MFSFIISILLLFDAVKFKNLFLLLKSNKFVLYLLISLVTTLISFSAIVIPINYIHISLFVKIFKICFFNLKQIKIGMDYKCSIIINNTNSTMIIIKIAVLFAIIISVSDVYCSLSDSSLD